MMPSAWVWLLHHNEKRHGHNWPASGVPPNYISLMIISLKIPWLEELQGLRESNYLATEDAFKDTIFIVHKVNF